MSAVVFPLAMAAEGEIVRLESIRGGDAVLQRLMALGLTPGVEFSVVQDAGGPLLLSVRDSRIALGRGMAQKIMVRPLAEVDSPPSENPGALERRRGPLQRRFQRGHQHHGPK